MIDFEDDLRRRLANAADDAPTGHDLLGAVERRVATRGRRATAARVAGVVAVLVLAAGGVVAVAGRDDPDAGTTRAVDPTDPALATDPAEAATTTAPLPSGWAPMADAPIPGRYAPVTVTTGDEVFVWGGQLVDEGAGFGVDGAVYDPAGDTWRAVPEAPLPAGVATGVWTGEEVVVVSAGAPPVDDQDRGGPAAAAAFDPATDTWRPLATPPPSVDPHVGGAVWTGTEVVVVSPDMTTSRDVDPVTVARYDPGTDTWASGTATDAMVPGAVAWTGTEVVLVGSANTDPATDAADEMLVRAYDPATDRWRALPWGLEAGPRTFLTVAWTGDRLFVGGGLTFTGDEQAQAAEAALLDPATGAWTPTRDAPVPFFGDDRVLAPATGNEVLVLGGGGGGALPPAGLGTGPALAYDPATDTWATGSVRPGAAVAGTTPVWAAGRAVVPFGTDTVDPLQPPPVETTGPAGGVTYVP